MRGSGDETLLVFYNAARKSEVSDVTAYAKENGQACFYAQ
jgi:hypothetical protein